MKKNKNSVIKVSWTKDPNGKIFGAFRWNPFVMSMYEEIFKEIVNKYDWDVQYGAKSILKIDKNLGDGIKASDIENFINRNKQLYDIFVKGISSCDIFIADITNHNPNVLLELGIAIQLNKNILIVTNQDLTDLPFDIRGLEAKIYSSKKDLQNLIETQINIYNKIINQNFESPDSIIKKYQFEGGFITNKTRLKLHGIPKLRNLKIKIDFRFLYITNENLDWFGIFLRSQGKSNDLNKRSSELILVRCTGETRSVTWPEQRAENDGEKVQIFDKNMWHSLEVLIDENGLQAWVDKKQKDEKPTLEDRNLLIEESFGDVFIGCNDHHHGIFFTDQENRKPNPEGDYLNIEYRNLEIIDLSTTANIFD